MLCEVLRFCGTRGDTKIADEARYSAPSCWPIIFKYCSIFEKFAVEYAQSTVHNRVHKADLQPNRYSDHVAVEGTVIRLND